ncbi:uncharacterized protein LOC132194802 [Neocloeon triangulifer]|uniref:uncharacterized protein LOC132194802 n=1 Tax=Neocloeon triangulifer TaxID=2078957 RepID=UPI00286EBCCC|nr:uncharacterized protein LOC132194802 [Neocloeon triangulifer]
MKSNSRFVFGNIFVFLFVLHFVQANLIDSLLNIFKSRDSELEKLLAEDEKHHRLKRQDSTAAPTQATPPAYGYNCPTELYRRMDKCCKLPTLYPVDVLNKCTGRNLVSALPKGPRKGIRPVQLRLRKNFLVSSPKNSSIKSKIEDICKVHCIFKQQRWLTPENFVDENLMYSTMQILTPPGPWQNLLITQYIRTECSGMSNAFGDFTANVTNMYGQKCMIAPFRLLRCIKRSMILAYNYCPGIVAQNQQCDLDRNFLRQCDPYSL